MPMLLLFFKRRLPCIKNNQLNFFPNEKEFILNWKKSFNPYIINESYLKIFFIDKLSQSLDKLCTHNKKEDVHYLTFFNTSNAQIAYESLNQYSLNWSKRLNGKTIEIIWQSHSLETKDNLRLVLKNFFYQHKISLQAKRNKLIKKNAEDKKRIDAELKYIESINFFKIE